jgi:glycosyltransferase involved in cell wall biosynthesis
MPARWIEYAKTIARYVAGRDEIASREYLWLGHHRAIKKILQGAACLLPNSESEYQRLVKTFRIKKNYFVVPNGIDTEIFPPAGDVAKVPLMVVCAARIEGIKNQLNLIRALRNSKFNLYLIGDPAPNQLKYYEACRRTAAKNIFFINNLPQRALRDHYARATVHVLPSWFETTGLSSVEAAAMGCNIVISEKGDAKEYFGNEAFYCDPASPASILQAVESAAASQGDDALQTKIRTKFTWEQAAFITIRAYRTL